MKKLVIYESDDPLKVVSEFSQCYKLNIDQHNKLVSVVAEQLENILPRIEESDEEDLRDNGSLLLTT